MRRIPRGVTLQQVQAGSSTTAAFALASRQQNPFLRTATSHCPLLRAPPSYVSVPKFTQARCISFGVTSPAMDTHQKEIERITAQVQDLYKRGEKFRISHGSTNSTRPSTVKERSNIVSTASLSNVLHVDKEKKTIMVEPNVPMDRLVEATLRHGLIPPVVMEFPGITVGGGYAGTSGESSSFKHGYFNETINWVEMVLATGEVVRCSRTERPDLFHGAAGAVGSMGVTTLVEIQLIEAKKYVEVTYHPVSSVGEAMETSKKHIQDMSLDYVDGILYSKTQGAIVTGRMTDEAKSGLPIQTFSNPWDPWYYMHVQERISKEQGPVTEVIPLAEYCFRYDRGGFWVGASAFDYMKFPFNKYTRWWLDDFLHTRMLYTALHASGQSQTYVVQDLGLPFETAEQFVDYTADKFKIWPLWLCPLKQTSMPTIHPHHSKIQADGKPSSHMINIGLWGQGPKNRDDFIDQNRDLEKKLVELEGMKWLYAHTYYTEEEFWKIYPKEWYNALREKYNATTLPSVHEKTCVDVEAEKQKAKTWGSALTSIWPLGGFYAIRKAIQSKTYLAARASEWRVRK